MDKKKVWDVLKTPLKILVTGALLYFVFQKIELKEVRAVYSQSNPLYFLLAIFTFFCSQVISSHRLLGFFRAKGLQLAFGYNLKLYLLGMFYNLFLPGGIGGDGYKVYVLRTKFDVSAKKLITAIFADRLSGLWAMAFLAMLFVFYMPEIVLPATPILLAFAAGTLLYLFIAVRLLGIDLATAINGHLKALLVQGLQVVTVVVILQALNFKSDMLPYLLTFLVSSLVAIFPFTIGGLGAREYVFVLAAGVLPMEEGIAVSLSLAFYLVSAVVALAGVYFLFRSNEFRSIPDKKEMEEKDALVAKP